MESAKEQSLRELAENKERLLKEIKDLQQMVKKIDEEVWDCCGDYFLTAMKKAGKDTGQVTVPLPDGGKMTGEVKKVVKWDSKKLQESATKLPWDKVQKVFDIKFSVKEATYSALTDESLKQELEQARTVEHKPQPIQIRWE